MTNRTELNAMIAGYLRNHTIKVIPEGVKAYPWAKEQDWKDAISRHHVALEMAGLVLVEEEDVMKESLMSGAEHGQVYAYYMGDDEDTSDVTDLDRAAHQEWYHSAALNGEYEDYVPEPNWH